MGSVLVFYCFVNNYPKLSSLKQCLFLSSLFCSLQSGSVWLDSLLRVSQAETKGQQGSIPRGGLWGSFRVHSGGQQFPFPSQLLRAGRIPSRVLLSMFKPVVAIEPSCFTSLRLPPVLRFV